MKLWKIRDYALLLSAQTVSTLVGAGMNVIFPLLVLKFTGSPAAAGVVGLLRAAPYLILSLPLGALVDRWNRKRIMIMCQAVRAILFVVLGVLSSKGTISVWHIYIVCLLDGTLFVFFNIAEAAALSRVVPPDLLPQASSANEAGFGTAMILGPPVATLFYQSSSVTGLFSAGASCYVLSLVLLKVIPIEFNKARNEQRHNLIKDIVEGVRWLWGAQLVLLLAIIMGGFNLINSAMPLTAIMLVQRLGSSDTAVGTVVAFGGLGSVLGSLYGARWLRMHGFGQGIVLVVWLHAAAVVLLIVANSLPWLALCYGLVIGFYSLYAVMQFTYRIKSIPEELQGRVNSACRLIAFSLHPFGSGLVGISTELWGVAVSVAILVAFAVLLALVLTFSRSLAPRWHEGAGRGGTPT